MRPTALFLATLAALSAQFVHAQGDFLTLQDNVDPSGTELMCPTQPNNYVDCADVGALPERAQQGIGFGDVAAATFGSPGARPASSP